MSEKKFNSFGSYQKLILCCASKKGELKTPFSLVDKAIYLNNKKDVKAILPDVLEIF